MSKRITDFILRDVSNKNESKKAAVATRLCCLIMLLYTCLFMGISFVGGSTSGGIIVAAMAIGYIFFYVDDLWKGYSISQCDI